MEFVPYCEQVRFIMEAQARRRPFPVTLLAIFAGIAAVLAVVHLLQALGIIPYMIGEVAIRSFNIWYVIMWGLMVWVWVWLVRMLWRVDPSAWMFLLIISIFNLFFDFVAMLGATTAFPDVALSFLLNGLILLYTLLPSTKDAFGIVRA
jgi:hypothetical protein